MIKRNEIKDWWYKHSYMTRIVAIVILILSPILMPIAYILDHWADFQSEFCALYNNLTDLIKWNVGE